MINYMSIYGTFKTLPPNTRAPSLGTQKIDFSTPSIWEPFQTVPSFTHSHIWNRFKPFLALSNAYFWNRFKPFPYQF